MEEPKSTWSLIAIPAVITLAITLLRLAGELEHWPSPWFSRAAGGGAAIVGISWLPILFGPWFAVKLARSGQGAESAGKAIGLAFLAIIVLVAGGAWLTSALHHISPMALLPFAVMLIAAFIPGMGWRALGKTLLAYAFAARLPVLVVYFLAMTGNGGNGWGTHYDAAPPGFPHLGVAAKFIYLGLLPQMTLWIAWTVCSGALFGSIAAALVHRKKAESAASA